MTDCEDPATDLPTATILVVDDEPHIRDLANEILRQHGFDVLLADSGPAALELHAHHHQNIGLVVLDMMMPEFTGWNVLQALAARDPEVRVLLSSGFANLPPSTQLPAQVCGVLPKPYRPSELAATVLELMKTRS